MGKSKKTKRKSKNYAMLPLFFQKNILGGFLCCGFGSAVRTAVAAAAAAAVQIHDRRSGSG